MDLQWWITTFGIPAFGFLLAVDKVIHSLLSAQIAVSNERVNRLQKQHDDLSKELSDYKLQAAMSFATNLYARDIEMRTTQQLAEIKEMLNKITERLMK